MKRDIEWIIGQLQDTYRGEPWYGRPVRELLAEVPREAVFRQPGGQHSILELVWHIITWREFTIDRLQHSPQMRLAYFEQNDWRKLDPADTSLWQQGLERLDETQEQLLALLRQQEDVLLEQIVPERDYNYRKLLYGMIQHDIYHLGQVAYVLKMERAGRR